MKFSMGFQEKLGEGRGNARSEVRLARACEHC
jgi:hypothetical protein